MIIINIIIIRGITVLEIRPGKQLVRGGGGGGLNLPP